MFHDVSVLFSDVVGFTHICSLISPMEVVTMLNNMYTVFDQISEQHNVYKVSDNLWLTASFLILHQTWECTNIFSQEFSDLKNRGNSLGIALLKQFNITHSLSLSLCYSIS